MDFTDSEVQKLLRDSARSYLAGHFTWDRLFAFERGTDRLQPADVDAIAQLGWMSLLAPERSGGGGATLLESAAVIDEVGYASVPAPVTVSNVAAHVLAAAGADSELRDLGGGQQRYTVSEASRRRGRLSFGGAPAAQVLSVAAGRLTGTLPQVPFADLAGRVLAPVTVDGRSGFASVPLAGARLEQVPGLDRANYFDVTFDSTGAGDLAVLGEATRAEELHELCDATMTALSLIELVGLMRRVLEMSASYISNRVQFGQPVAKFQAARHRAAELLMQEQSTRWAAYHALWQFQLDPKDSGEIWLTKHYAIRGASRMYEIAHLLHGGVGVGVDYPLHLFTQAMAAFIVRGGTMNEMTSRFLESMRLRTVAAPA